MRIRFWGTRGSLPTPLSTPAIRTKLKTALRKAQGRTLDSDEKIEAFIAQELDFATSSTYGGNSACVQVDIGSTSEYVLCDLGSGVREFGNHILATHGPAKKHTFHFLMSHVHWDHIMGFPFFTPAYIPGNVIRIYGCHPIDTLLQPALRKQHSSPCFPVDFAQLGAKIEFVQLDTTQRFDIAGLNVRAFKQHHSDDSFGFRFEHGGRTLIYSTDSEHKFDSIGDSYPIVEFFRDADLVIFDAMYSLADMVSVKEDWGHSSNMIGVELCHLAGVKHLCLFHHEPIYSDAKIQQVLEETIRFEALSRQGPSLAVSSAYDGLEIQL